MYKLKNTIITIEDTEDQIGVNPDGSPKYQTYGTYYDDTEGIQPAIDRLKASIAAKEQIDTKATQAVAAVNTAAYATTNIVEGISKKIQI